MPTTLIRCVHCNEVINIKDIPIGSILWKNGHVGVFYGWKKRTPYYIAEDGSLTNCRINKLKDSEFTYSLIGINGYDLTLFKPKKVKIKKSCNAYKNPNNKFLKRRYRKGKKP